MKNINKTLREKLFQRPQFASPKMDVYYTMLRSRIFPDEEQFIALLSADNYDEQYEYAERILTRICYESNYPPTKEMFADVLSLEYYSKVDHIQENTFIPRDHYIHVIYVYMMGIYIFFYNNTFFNFITSQYRYARELDAYENDELCCLKDFVSAWKYFAFYHDLGYQLEIITKTGNDKLKDKYGNMLFCKSFDQEKQKFYFCKQNAVKILTRLLLVGRICADASDESFFKEKLINKLKHATLCEYKHDSHTYEERDTTRIIDGCLHDNVIHLRKINSHRTMKSIIPVLGIENMILIGSKAQTNGICYIATSDGTKVRVFCVNGYELSSEVEASPEVLFYDDYVDQEIQFSYFANIESWRTDYKHAIEDLEDTFSVLEDKFIGISSDEQLIKYEYAIFDLISSEAQDIFTTDSEMHEKLFFVARKCGEEKDQAKTELRKSILSTLSSRYKKELQRQSKHIALSIIEEQVESSRVLDTPLTDIAEILHSHAASISDALHMLFADQKDDTEAAIELKLTMEYYSRLDAKVRLWIKITDIYLEIASALNSYQTEYSFDYADNTTKIDYDQMRRVIEPSIQKYIKEYAGSLDTMLDSYEFQHGLKDDHGTHSAFNFINMFDMYMHISSSENIRNNRYIYILFNMSFPCGELHRRYHDNYKHIVIDVAYSIYVHNLYPSWFHNKALQDMRTDINSPFAYLALLCDSLQEWNRPHAQHPATFSQRPNCDSSDAFDIQVSSGYIYVYENRTAKSQKRLNERLNSLNSYMNLPNSFICNGDSV